DASATGAVAAARASGIPWALTLTSLLQSPRALRSQSDAFGAPNRVLALAGEPLERARADIPGHVRLVSVQPWHPPAPFPAELSYFQAPGAAGALVGGPTTRPAEARPAATAIQALRDEQVRVLITIPDATAVPSASNVRVERFVPHTRVLERAAAVVCSGGIGLVQKSIAARVPLVIVPLDGDRPEIARRVVEIGAGVTITPKRLSRRRLRVAVRDVIVRYDRDPAAASRPRATDSPNAFADVAEELLHERRRIP